MAQARTGRLGFWRGLLNVVAIAYPVALLAIILGLRLVGERWWLTSAALYLPRLGFALPLPVLTLALLVAGPRRVLASQLVAALLILFPLMGLRFSRAPSPTPGAAARMRVLSMNIAAGAFGVDNIVAELRGADADVILLQEARSSQREAIQPGLSGYHFHESGQYMLATRYQIEDAFTPPRIASRDNTHQGGFVRYRLATPAGSINVWNAHPISPRDGLEELRGEGFRSEIASGRIFRALAAADVEANTALRAAQVQALAEDARGSSLPVLIAGDTNLPELSWLFAHWLGGYRDGFSQVGSGFGYTFPAPKHQWMRIDRVLVDARLRFVGFRVSDRTPAASDHRAVIADIELPAAGR